ncbi:UNVERIFIED_CONTAM: isochorismatase family protein [Streptococcus canis]|uniref:Isochorismatase family protein n=1 Tax=Streptococcus canis TaxID=1329 RepID=A0AAE4Q944_STRCB|nr:isochorismatase family protein [Streptococcus canis]MDV5977592.1 isochorismatase family protein [Streptococcus canis]
MIDFNKTALVLIDLQKGILDMPMAPHSQETITSNAQKLVERFRQEGAFIAFVRVKFHDGKDKLNPNAMVQLPGKKPEAAFSDFDDKLGVTETDYVINKRGFSAFFGTDLDLQLRRRGIDTIVLGGISTHAGVDTTARDAYQYGYDQYFLTDMMGAANAALHDFPIKNLFPLMGQTMTTQDFLDTLNR